jgi:hypothetical protein
LDNHRDYFFGFKSIAQAKEVFDKEIWDILAKEGALLVHYKVAKKNVIVGNSQIIFKKESATKVNAEIPDFDKDS